MDQNKQMLIESSVVSPQFSMETLAEEIIPVVTEKYEFDYRGKSIKINNF